MGFDELLVASLDLVTAEGEVLLLAAELEGVCEEMGGGGRWRSTAKL